MAKKKVKEESDSMADVKPAIANDKENTLMKHISRIVDIAVAEKLSEESFSKADENLKYVADRLNITKREAMLLALLLECGYTAISVKELTCLVKCRYIYILSLIKEDKGLIAKKMIKKREATGRKVSYKVSSQLVDAVINNEDYIAKNSFLTLDEFFEELNNICDETRECAISYKKEVLELINDNMHLEFCKVYKKYFGADDTNGILFMIFVYRYIHFDDDDVRDLDYEDYFSSHNVRVFRNQLAENRSPLIIRNLLEPNGTEGVRDGGYRITDRAKEEFFMGMDELKAVPQDMKELQSCEHIVPKELFYNNETDKQIKQLSSLLMVDNFVRVQQRMEEKGLRKGFACLFYGSPGTGKTETVYQLARQTGRGLFVIDVAKIKSCWVGESEKNIRQAFERYKQCVDMCNRAHTPVPILLFNEADAVLGIRKSEAINAVDKMENSIQNIILQSMETLDGIMIATTNLTNNLDKAFERRFIYKIEFTQPVPTTKCAIWQYMVPDLDAQNAMQLATLYDFSGGQIENIVRKRAIDAVLYGKEPDMEELKNYCEQELISKQLCHPIGFKR